MTYYDSSSLEAAAPSESYLPVYQNRVLVLGTGLGRLAESKFEAGQTLDYRIFHTFLWVAVESHSGKLLLDFSR